METTIFDINGRLLADIANYIGISYELLNLIVYFIFFPAIHLYLIRLIWKNHKKLSFK